MKPKKAILFLALLLSTAAPFYAQSRWGILGGADVTMVKSKYSSLTGARGGFYVGGLYDLQLSERWYFQPQLLFARSGEKYKTNNIKEFYDTYNLEIPLLASYKIPCKTVDFRINGGIFATYGLFGVKKEATGEGNAVREGKRDAYSLPGDERFKGGVQLGISVEQDHLFYSFDTKCSFLRKNKEFRDPCRLMFRLGVGYKF